MKRKLTFSIAVFLGLVLLSALAAPVSHAQSIEVAEMAPFCDSIKIVTRSSLGTLDFKFEFQRTNPLGPVDIASGSFQQTVLKPDKQFTFIPWGNISGVSYVLPNGKLAGGDYVIVNAPVDDPIGRTITLSGFNTIPLHSSWPALHCDCGDGDLDPGEECDDGNNTNGDGCDENCVIEPYCGDSILDPGEACDDGNNTNGDGCDANCDLEPFCGDGILDPGEECDDGNNTNGDGCNANCKIEPFCGNGVLNTGEACDDGNNTSGDGCSADCKIEFCGDGIVQPGLGEKCDDGNNMDGDGCNANCMNEFCGDGILQPSLGEECDDGNNNNGDGCSAICTKEQRAGQGCTPGYWKQSQHFDSWTAPYTPDTLFSDVFDNAFPGKTLLNVMEQGGGDLKALGRHTVAALLNAASSNVSYDRSTMQVIMMFNNVYPGSKGQYNGIKDILEGFNEQGCPLN